MKQLVRTAFLAVLALATLSVIATAGKPAAKDFISYWSAGHLLLQHQDPYASDLVFATEQAQGFDAARALIMRNPPWALWLVLPLGLFSAHIALLLWMAAALGCVAACLQAFHVAPRDRVIAYCFAPVYACLASGQSSPFLLLGVSLFVAFWRTRPFLAGAALLLVACKPHLFLVLLPVLLLDCAVHRRLRVLAGASLAIAFASAFAFWLDPHIWTEYARMIRHASLDSEFLQTPAYLFRMLIAPRLLWLQFVPCALGTGGAVCFYWRRRTKWDWATDAVPLLFVTLLVSPYAWVTDEILLLPAVLLAMASPLRAHYSGFLLLAINGVVLTMLIAQVQLSSGAYLWTSTAWGAWYLYSRRMAPSPAAAIFDSHLQQA